VVIQLTQLAACSEREAAYQLAQECIHLLSPTGDAKSNVLEEGLGEVLATRYFECAGFGEYHTANPKYLRAWVLARELLTIDVDIIRRIRKEKPVISHLTKEDLLIANSSIRTQLAEDLTEQF
jgi:hypothetical protein